MAILSYSFWAVCYSCCGFTSNSCTDLCHWQLLLLTCY